VYSLGHSVNKFFAECCNKNTRKRWGLPSVFFTLGKRKNIFLGKKEKKKMKKKIFVECPDLGHSVKEKNIFSGKEGEEKNKK